jgi:hypothetical protein
VNGQLLAQTHKGPWPRMGLIPFVMGAVLATNTPAPSQSTPAPALSNHASSIRLRLEVIHAQEPIGPADMEAEIALWQTETDRKTGRMTSATLHTTAVLTNGLATPVDIPPIGDLAVSVTSGTVMLPPYRGPEKLPNGTPVQRVNRPFLQQGKVIPQQAVIQVTPLVWVEGRAILADGTPLSGVTVKGWYNGPVSGAPQVGTVTETDAAGKYRVQAPLQYSSGTGGYKAVKVSVGLEKVGYLSHGSAMGNVELTLDKFPTGSMRAADLVMEPGQALTGRVVDGKGQAVPEAWVHVRGLSASGYPTAGHTRTDADGKYGTTLPPGFKTVTVHATTGDLKGFLTMTEFPGTIEDLVLRQFRKIPLDIVGADSNHKEQVMWEIREFSPYAYDQFRVAQDPDDQLRWSIGDLQSHAQGNSKEFQFIRAHIGSSVLVQAQQKGVGESDWAIITPRQNNFPKPVHLAIKPYRSVTVEVVDSSGQPAERVTCNLITTIGRKDLGRTEADGRVTLTEVPSDTASIEVTAYWARAQLVKLPRNDGETLKVTLEAQAGQKPPAPIQTEPAVESTALPPQRRIFQVVDAVTGKSIPNPKFGNQFYRVDGVQKLDEDTYMVVSHYGHPFGLPVQANGYMQKHFNLSASGTTEVLKLHAGTRVVGQIVNESGEPVPIHEATIAPSSMSTTRTSASLSSAPGGGQFAFEGLDKGSYSIRIDTKGAYAPLTTTVEVLNLSTTITLGSLIAKPGVAVTVRTEEQGTSKPLSGEKVDIIIQGDNYVPIGPYTAISDDQGIARFTNLPEGPLTVTHGGKVLSGFPRSQVGRELKLTFPLGTGVMEISSPDHKSDKQHIWRALNQLIIVGPNISLPIRNSFSEPSLTTYSHLPEGTYLLKPRGDWPPPILGEPLKLEVRAGTTTTLDVGSAIKVYQFDVPQDPAPTNPNLSMLATFRKIAHEGIAETTGVRTWSWLRAPHLTVMPGYEVTEVIILDPVQGTATIRADQLKAAAIGRRIPVTLQKSPFMITLEAWDADTARPVLLTGLSAWSRDQPLPEINWERADTFARDRAVTLSFPKPGKYWIMASALDRVDTRKEVSVGTGSPTTVSLEFQRGGDLEIEPVGWTPPRTGISSNDQIRIALNNGRKYQYLYPRNNDLALRGLDPGDYEMEVERHPNSHKAAIQARSRVTISKGVVTRVAVTPGDAVTSGTISPLDPKPIQP